MHTLNCGFWYVELGVANNPSRMLNCGYWYVLNWVLQSIRSVFRILRALTCSQYRLRVSCSQCQYRFPDTQANGCPQYEVYYWEQVRICGVVFLLTKPLTLQTVRTEACSQHHTLKRLSVVPYLKLFVQKGALSNIYSVLTNHSQVLTDRFLFILYTDTPVSLHTL